MFIELAKHNHSALGATSLMLRRALFTSKSVLEYRAPSGATVAMAFKEFHYRWEFDLQSSPEKLWPLVADTNRFNRDTGVPAVKKVESQARAYHVYN